MVKAKILVTSRSFRKMEGPHKQILLDAGYEIVNSPYDRPLEAHELAEIIPDIDGAILGVDDVSAEVFENANKLKIVSRYGVGIDKVDLKAATAKGVVVTNTPGANANSVAELALGLMLGLARNIPRQDRQVRSENWSLLKGLALSGKTLGLLGMGRIGQRVAELANAFNMQIIFYDPYPPQQEIQLKLRARLCSFEDLIAESDFLSLHLPITKETKSLLNAEAIASMKSGAFIINTARGGIIDEQALVKALETGHIAGAAFDAFEEEPSIGNTLLEQPNFISTPHIGSSTEQTTLQMGLMASENALAILRGERSEYVVNPDVYERLKP